MRCPFCSNEDTQVKDSRPTEDGSAIRRRRLCPACGSRFTSFERVQLRDLTVIKKDLEAEYKTTGINLPSVRNSFMSKPFKTVNGKTIGAVNIACKGEPLSLHNIVISVAEWWNSCRSHIKATSWAIRCSTYNAKSEISIATKTTKILENSLLSVGNIPV